MLKRLNRYKEYLFGLPKSIYFCFRQLPFYQAIKLPILVNNNVLLSSLKGKIIVNDCKTGLVKIGFGNVGIYDKYRCRSIWENNGTVCFSGGAHLGHGCKVSCGHDGIMTFGKGFVCTAESEFVCMDNIIFGEDVLISWKTLIMDTDFHKVIFNKKVKDNHKAIIIGNHVWIGCYSIILKGVKIGNNSIIAAGSVVTSRNFVDNIIIGGNPAKSIREQVDWQK